MIDKAALLATYPLVIMGGFCTFAVCLFGLYKSRSSHLPLWWLLLGACVTGLTLSLENFYFGYARAIEAFAGWNQPTLWIVGFKFGHAFGLWCKVLAVVSLTLSLQWRTSGIMLALGFILSVILYAVIVLVFDGNWLIWEAELFKYD